jgi:hypothetical protein
VFRTRSDLERPARLDTFAWLLSFLSRSGARRGVPPIDFVGDQQSLHSCHGGEKHRLTKPAKNGLRGPSRRGGGEAPPAAKFRDDLMIEARSVSPRLVEKAQPPGRHPVDDPACRPNAASAAPGRASIVPCCRPPAYRSHQRGQAVIRSRPGATPACRIAALFV